MTEAAQESSTQTNDAPPMASAASADLPWLKSYQEGVDYYADLTPKPLYELLDNAVSNFPSNTCTNFIGSKLTYREIGKAVDHAAAGLQKLGVKKGTKVGLFFPNCPSHIIFYFATLKLGGTVVNFNPLYSIEELAYQVKDSETAVMVTLDLKVLFEKVETLIADGVLDKTIVCSFPALLPGLKKTLFKLFKGKELSKPTSSKVASKVILADDLMKNDGKYERAAINPLEDLAVLQYTGGTTGTPKGAMLTHANLYVNTVQMVQWAPDLLDGQERVMGILPFFHVFAMTVVMNFGVAKAAELILVPKFEIDDGMKLIAATKPTTMPGVPTLYTAIANYPKLKDFDLSSLKYCLSGGAPLPLELKREFEGVTGCKLVEGYGLSETSPVATANPFVGPVKENSIGIPMPGTVISIRNPDNSEEEMPQGERGEICIKGPQVMRGYFNKPDETANVFVGDFLRTGDVGYMDEDGFTYIVDRMKDLILCSGYNVYPRRVEEAIHEFPPVEEVTVIGIKDEYRGEAPKAFIKLKDGQNATVEDVMEFITPKLSKIELPSQIEFRDELPKTMVGKLSKKELKEEEAAKSGS